MKLKALLLCLSFLLSSSLFAVQIGKTAPNFTLKNQDGGEFSLETNKGKVWTVLYFYPKADTPGCTKQACAFRDAIKVIEKENTRVYGVSTNSVKDLKKFQDKYKLKFELLSDEEGKVSKLYDTKIPLLKMSKRHTFILDPQLHVRFIETDVDPAMDAQVVANKIIELQKQDSEKHMNKYEHNRHP